MGNHDNTARKLIIIGGGFAGLECALGLANDDRFEITLIDRTNHHLFQPLLYQVATASLAAPDIARSIRQILDKAKNVTVLMDEVEDISPEKKIVSAKSGTTFEYDYLLLAAGAKTSYFGNDHWKDNSMGLKTLADAQDIRRTILSNLEHAEMSNDEEERKRLMTVAIIGGGPTGVELAGACADLVIRSLHSNFRRIDTSKLKIILIENSHKILEHFEDSQSAYAKKRLQELGVEVLNNSRVTDVKKGKVELLDGTVIESEAIVWAAGVAANDLTSKLGVETDRGGRVRPNLDLSLKEYSDVFVAGDLVGMNDRNGTFVPGVAPAAVQMGKHVAKVLKEEMRLEKTKHAENKVQLRPKFKYTDKGMMAIIGKNTAVLKAAGISMNGFFAWIAWLLVHLLFLVGFRNKLAVLLGWAYSYIVNKPEARLIIHPPGIIDAPHKRQEKSQKAA